MPGNTIRRQTQVGNPTCLLGFSGRDSVDSGVFDSSTLTPGGVDEVQIATVSGTPTGGSFKLTYKGQTTASIAYNATGATVQAELRKLSRFGAAGTVSGSAGGPWTITFTGSKLGKKDQPLITLGQNALTGGTSPTVSIAESVKGDSTFSNVYVLRSGLPLMQNGAGTMLVEWDGASAATLVGIFDGQIELLDPSDVPTIPVYNHECVFDKAVVKGYATNFANFETWAAKHACQFKSQGS